jgi:hypothetical protein
MFSRHALLPVINGCVIESPRVQNINGTVVTMFSLSRRLNASHYRQQSPSRIYPELRLEGRLASKEFACHCAIR